MSHHFFTEDTVAKELTFGRLFRKLWPFIWQHKRAVWTALLLIGVFVCVGRTLPFLFGYAIDAGLKAQNLTVIYFVAASYLILETTRALLSFLQNRHIQRLGNTVLYEIREKLMAHVQRLPVTYFEKNPAGRTVTRVTNDVFALGELFSQGFSAIFINVVEMVSIFASLAYLSPLMTGVTLLILPPLSWICMRLSQKIRFQFGAAKRKLAMINAFTAESMGGIKVLQAFDRTAESRQFFNESSLEYRNLQLSTVKLFATLWPVIEAFNVFTIAVALMLGAYLNLNHGLSLGELGAYILLLQGFFKPIKTILERYNQLQNSLASADRVFEVLEEPQENREGRDFTTPRLAGAIDIRNLHFRYAATSPYALRGINVKIEPGMSVALVGRTGSGKTSIISLMQKLYENFEGEILIDGLSIRELAPQALRPRVGVVQQDGFVFSGTFFSNISLNDPKITRARASWALQQAQCEDVIRRHGGLDGRVFERGANLSAGERQLLAFARVLAFDPDILILDEATANIDSVSERKIQLATDAITKGRTSVIIAHRLSTILHCDLILLLEKGEIIERGRHHELLELKGRYYDLYQAATSHGSHVESSTDLILNK